MLIRINKGRPSLKKDNSAIDVMSQTSLRA